MSDVAIRGDDGGTRRRLGQRERYQALRDTATESLSLRARGADSLVSDVAIRGEGLVKRYRTDEVERCGVGRYAAMEAITGPVRVKNEQSGEGVGERHRGDEGERHRGDEGEWHRGDEGERHRGDEGERCGALWNTAMKMVGDVREAPIRW